jgi:ComF family protein
MNWRTLIEDVCDIIYPPANKCIFCNQEGKLIVPYSICEHCWDTLPFTKPPLCDICGKPIDSAKLRICCDCVKYSRSFVKAGAVLEYMPSVHETIYRYKYKGHSELAKPLGLLMAHVASRIAWPDMDVLVPVPLHYERLRQRGYNQSALLARYMGYELNLPVLDKALYRCRDTKAQATLDRAERRANIAGAFAVSNLKYTEGKTIMLIDDILTTGATADACAQALLGGGAKAVYVFTLATGVLK